MSDFEKYVDTVLRAIDRLPRAQRALLRSTRLITLEGFDLGDQITITLNDAEQTPAAVISGAVYLPEKSLIQAYAAPNLPEVVGKNLFLSATVLAQTPGHEPSYETHLDRVGGNQGFAYYLPEDTYDDRYGRHVHVLNNVKQLPYTYGKITVNDRTLFDFTETTGQSVS